MKQPSILILGAGLAGLSAAEILSDAGFRVVLLEAKSEVGGRTHSQRWMALSLNAGLSSIIRIITRASYSGWRPLVLRLCCCQKR